MSQAKMKKEEVDIKTNLNTKESTKNQIDKVTEETKETSNNTNNTNNTDQSHSRNNNDNQMLKVQEEQPKLQTKISNTDY